MMIPTNPAIVFSKIIAFLSQHRIKRGYGIAQKRPDFGWLFSFEIGGLFLKTNTKKWYKKAKI